jgi:hypothetical protein
MGGNANMKKLHHRACCAVRYIIRLEIHHQYLLEITGWINSTQFISNMNVICLHCLLTNDLIRYIYIYPYSMYSRASKQRRAFVGKASPLNTKLARVWVNLLFIVYARSNGIMNLKLWQINLLFGCGSRNVHTVDSIKKFYIFNAVFYVEFLGLLRLAETRLAETTIGRRLIGQKLQLVDVTISRNHDWPKAPIGQFQVFLLVLLFYFLWLSIPLKFYLL